MVNINELYYGFIESLDPAMKDQALTCLSGKSIDTIGEHTIASDVVEEIVRRGGQFYTATEARNVAPFTIKYDDTFCASFPYLDNEKRQSNLAWRDQNWCALIVTQYCYGKFLTSLIAEGKLTVDMLTASAKEFCT